jgi:LexA DNA binding domain-containing protein
MTTPLTDRQRLLIAAIDGGASTLRELMAACGISSTSVAKHHLELLAKQGHVALVRGHGGAQAYSGADFCEAWDAACRLSGNPFEAQP